MKKITALVIVLLIAATTFPFVYGRERTWHMLAGPADLGPVDLATLTRRTSPNDALLCRDSFCPSATADSRGDIYKVSAAKLAETFDRGVSGEAELLRVDDGGDPLYRRYVQRSALMKFPDTADVRFFPLSEDQSYMVIYSRSQLGYGDFGTNRKRMRRWMTYTDELPNNR